MRERELRGVVAARSIAAVFAWSRQAAATTL